VRLINTQFILKEKRYSWIDYDKGISIILVGYGHALDALGDNNIYQGHSFFFAYLGMLLYGFRMPLFFFISGVFLSGSLQRKSYPGYVKGRINNILYPLIVWGILEIVVWTAYNYHQTHSFNLHLFLSLFTNPRIIGNGHLWYLNALFAIGVVYAFLKVKLKVSPVAQIFLGLGLYCVSAYLHVNDIDAGILTDYCAFFIYFAIGDTISSIVLNKENVDRFASLKIFFPLFIIFAFMQYYCTHVNLTVGQGSDRFVEYKRPFLYMAEAMIGCILSVNVSFQLQKHKILRFLRVIGFHSLFIYCMQFIFISAAKVLLVYGLKFTYYPVLVPLLWISGVIPPMLFYTLCLRYNMWRLFVFVKPEREIAALKGEETPSLAKAS